MTKTKKNQCNKYVIVCGKKRSKSKNDIREKMKVALFKIIVSSIALKYVQPFIPL
jgi:hypothetical protein